MCVCSVAFILYLIYSLSPPLSLSLSVSLSLGLLLNPLSFLILSSPPLPPSLLIAADTFDFEHLFPGMEFTFFPDKTSKTFKVTALDNNRALEDDVTYDIGLGQSPDYIFGGIAGLDLFETFELTVTDNDGTFYSHRRCSLHQLTCPVLPSCDRWIC